MSEAAKKDVDVSRIVWFTMLASTVLYAILTVFINSQSMAREIDPGLLHWISVFACVATGMQLLVVFLLKQLIAGIVEGRYKAYCIIRLALIESIALYGLLLAVFGQTNSISLAFIGFAFVMLATMGPSDAEREAFSKILV